MGDRSDPRPAHAFASYPLNSVAAPNVSSWQWEAVLRQALKIFTHLGASAATQLTRQKMRQLGIRSIPAGPRSATRAHPLGLTRREREVLELICAGHTNAEIAAKLFISPKTVDHHVSAVLAKLDAPTREVAATHAARLGLVSTRELPEHRAGTFLSSGTEVW